MDRDYHIHEQEVEHDEEEGCDRRRSALGRHRRGVGVAGVCVASQISLPFAIRKSVSERQLIEGLHCIAFVGLHRCADLVSEWASNHAPGREVFGE